MWQANHFIILIFLAFKVEYDSPQALLQKKGGYFKMLVDGSGDRKALYAAVERKANKRSSVLVWKYRAFTILKSQYNFQWRRKLIHDFSISALSHYTLQLARMPAAGVGCVCNVNASIATGDQVLEKTRQTPGHWCGFLVGDFEPTHTCPTHTWVPVTGPIPVRFGIIDNTVHQSWTGQWLRYRAECVWWLSAYGYVYVRVWKSLVALCCQVLPTNSYLICPIFSLP